jgi:uncharacterized protein YndB with AHSA1/START domain
MSQLSSEEVITKELFIECRPATLFSFFTDPEKMMRWMGIHVLLEPEIGGKYRIDVNGHDIALGEYVEIVPNEKIVMTFGWEKSKLVPPGASTLEFRFTPRDSGTVLVLTHSGLPTDKEVAMHQEGWSHFVSRLQKVAEGRDPGPDPNAVRAV